MIELSEATASVDADFRRQARDVWKTLEKRLEQIYQNIAVEFPKLDMINVSQHRGGKASGFHFKMKSSIGNIKVVIVPPNSDAGLEGEGEDWVLVIPALFSAEDLRFGVSAALIGLEKIVIHEVIHALDVQRGMVGRAQHAKDIGGYFKSPEEFNAYYQEGAARIESNFTLSHLSSQRAKAFAAERFMIPALKSFRGFEKYLTTLDYFEKDWMEHVLADRVYSKKFKKRLFGLYEYLKKEYWTSLHQTLGVVESIDCLLERD